MLLLFSAIDVQAQNRVTGKVTDDNGAGLPGVNVLVEGTSTGVITDTAGDYQIAVPDGSHVLKLKFSFVGFVTEKMEIGNQSIINCNAFGRYCFLAGSDCGGLWYPGKTGCNRSHLLHRR